MSIEEIQAAGDLADKLIAAEVNIQDRMWGPANERADASHNQLTRAATAQLVLTSNKMSGATPEDAFGLAQPFYPEGWSGFRDYGSNVANLVVTIAFLRSEIKRRILAGESTERAKRQPDQQFDPATGLPYVSSEAVIAANANN